MIKVFLGDQSFSYDVHSLVKAFFPSEDVTVKDIEDQSCANSEPQVFVVDYVEDGDRVACFVLENGIEINREYADISGLDRPDVKSAMKKALYRLLGEYTHQKLPWGTLTGIRPTKIPMKLMTEGCSDDSIYKYMTDEYFVSSDKIKLSTEIAHLERKIIDSTHKTDGYSLYVGIPFCPTTCMYCSFTSYPIVKFKDLVDKYLDTLEKEFCEVSKLNPGKILDSVYIGGGTPTTLEPRQIERLDKMLRKYFDFSNVLEYTMEAGRPDSLTEEKLYSMKQCGIGRISVNPQTMHDETLKIIGRRHTVEDTIRAFKMARDAGFDNINMDIILGLPGEDILKVKDTLTRISELGPDSLTVHSMAIKRAASMHQFLMEHEEIKSINTPEMMDMAISYAENMGLMPYYLYRQKNMAGNLENIGFAEEGKFGLYNILIMEEIQSIVACGAGTVTKRVFSNNDVLYNENGVGRIERCDNVKDVTLYIDKIDDMIERKRELFNL